MLVLAPGILFGIVLGGVVLFRLNSRLIPLVVGQNTTYTAVPAPKIGAPAPDFELQSLTGEQFQLSDFRIFIDQEGIIRVIHIGIMTEGQLDGYLAELGVSP